MKPYNLAIKQLNLFVRKFDRCGKSASAGGLDVVFEMSNMYEGGKDCLVESKYLRCPLAKSGCQLRSTRRLSKLFDIVTVINGIANVCVTTITEIKIWHLLVLQWCW